MREHVCDEVADWRRVVLALPLASCGLGDLEPAGTSLHCTACFPSCAADVDPNDLEGTARRLGCDPDVVVTALPHPGWVSLEVRPEIRVELARPVTRPESGHGCEGPIRLARIGSVGAIPDAIGADIVSHASLDSLPLWPPARECVEAQWRVDGTLLSLVPTADLARFEWYEVTVEADLALDGAELCSELAWRFTVSACGDGVVDAAESFVDWVCLGRVEAERGWFEPYFEECDDGNEAPHDGCSHLCVNETGWTCDAEGCRTRCGDAVRAGDEECDYGLHMPPGCGEDCRITPGYACGVGGCQPLDAAAR